jgi:hypothetical protein
MSVSPGMDGTAAEVGTTHAAPMEAAAAPIAAASTAASECIIGNQTCRDKNSCG